MTLKPGPVHIIFLVKEDKVRVDSPKHKQVSSSQKASSSKLYLRGKVYIMYFQITNL